MAQLDIHSVPAVLYARARFAIYSLFWIFFINLILVFLFEKTEFDTFTYYFSKVELSRFGGPAHRIYTSFVQEFMPVGYSKIQMLFYNSIIGRNSLNFMICSMTLCLLILAFDVLGILISLFCVLNVGFLMQSTGYKADCILACFSLGLAYLASKEYFFGQFIAVSTICALMLSIKWTSGLVILPAGLIFIYHFLLKTKGPPAKPRLIILDIGLAGLVFLVLSNFLDFSTYIQSYLRYRTFAPVQTMGVNQLVRPSLYLAAHGFFSYLLSSFFETFEPFWSYFAAREHDFGWLSVATLGAKNHIVLSPNQVYTSLTLIDTVAIFAALMSLKCKDSFVWICSVCSITFFFVSFSVSVFDTQSNRYFMPAQILAYVPLAYLCLKTGSRIATRSFFSIRSQNWIWVSLAVFVVIKTGRDLCLDKERNLVNTFDQPDFPIGNHSVRTFPGTVRRPIFRENAMTRLFRGWQGYQPVYLSMIDQVPKAEPLIILYDFRANSANYTFPFLKIREAANTFLIDVRSAQFADIGKMKSDFFLCFGKTSCDRLKSANLSVTLSAGTEEFALFKKSI